MTHPTTYPASAIDASYRLLPPEWDTPLARSIQASIGYQETKFLTRLQYGGGPAHSYWQFEQNGGVKGVMEFGGKVTEVAKHVCESLGVEWDRKAIWQAMATNDTLGAAMCRLLMYTDPYSLPRTEKGAWEMYLRTWRPGKPHQATWPDAYRFGLSL